MNILDALDLVVARLAVPAGDPAPVTEAVAAAVEPELVNVPGAWVDVTGLVDPTLRGTRVGVEVTLIVPANDRRTAYAALQTLYDSTVERLGVPDGDVRKQTTVLPDSPTGYPSLVLPYLVE